MWPQPGSCGGEAEVSVDPLSPTWALWWSTWVRTMSPVTPPDVDHEFTAFFEEMEPCPMRWPPLTGVEVGRGINCGRDPADRRLDSLRLVITNRSRWPVSPCRLSQVWRCGSRRRYPIIRLHDHQFVPRLGPSSSVMGCSRVFEAVGKCFQHHEVGSRLHMWPGCPAQSFV